MDLWLNVWTDLLMLVLVVLRISVPLAVTLWLAKGVRAWDLRRAV